jgi:hypothetical protein
MSERAIWLVVLLIGPAICFLMWASGESGKMKAQRKQKPDDDTIVKYAPMPRSFFNDYTGRPMSQMSDISMSDHIQRMLDEEHITVTKRVTMGSLNGTVDTNMVTVHMRKWPVFGISDHIAVMLYGKISLGTNIVSVGVYKDGMWTEAETAQGGKHD